MCENEELTNGIRQGAIFNAIYNIYDDPTYENMRKAYDLAMYEFGVMGEAIYLAITENDPCKTKNYFEYFDAIIQKARRNHAEFERRWQESLAARNAQNEAARHAENDCQNEAKPAPEIMAQSEAPEAPAACQPEPMGVA